MTPLEKIILEAEKEFDEKFTLPEKTILERDTCDACLKLHEKGEKNRYGNLIYCSAFHAYERTRKLGEQFSQEDPPSPEEFKSFLRSSIIKTLESVREMIGEKGHQQYDNTIWCNMDDILKPLEEVIKKNR